MPGCSASGARCRCASASLSWAPRCSRCASSSHGAVDRRARAAARGHCLRPDGPASTSWCCSTAPRRCTCPTSPATAGSARSVSPRARRLSELGRGPRRADALRAHRGPAGAPDQRPQHVLFLPRSPPDRPPFRLEDDTTWDTNIALGIEWGLRVIEKDEELRGRVAELQAVRPADRRPGLERRRRAVAE